MSSSIKIMIVAGEASGDAHAAKLVSAIREQTNANVEFYGAAGPNMRSVGVEPIVKSDELSIVGLAEIGAALPMFVRAFRKLKDAAITRRPDVAILVDFPDFNLRLARKLSKNGIRVVYYISPQLWAWRRYRVRIIKKYVEILLTILPFEKDWYLNHGVDHVEYVGNPLAREVFPSVDRIEFRRRYGISDNAQLIALLPGSRSKEIERILPEMVGAAKMIMSNLPNAKFIFASGGERNSEQILALLHELDPQKELDLLLVEGETYDALNAADVAAITSGTATLEAGILGVPMAVVYKGTNTNYRLLKPLINVDHYALINLLAGRRLVTELIQHDLTPTTLSNELLRLLDPEVNQKMRAELHETTTKLGEGGASKRAAEFILQLLRK